MAKRFRGYHGPRLKSGLPDRRTAAGKRAYARSEAAKRGWETRREKEKQRKRYFPPDYFPPGVTVVEEPIETVGGREYGKKGKR